MGTRVFWPHRELACRSPTSPNQPNSVGHSYAETSWAREGALADYHLAHAARADLERKLGLIDAARASYERALELARQLAERRFSQARLAQLATEVSACSA